MYFKLTLEIRAVTDLVTLHSGDKITYHLVWVSDLDKSGSDWTHLGQNSDLFSIGSKWDNYKYTEPKK